MTLNDFPPLSGIRVLELSNFLAAPMVGMFLADFGADVIKLERPGVGDEIRSWGNSKDGVGLYSKVVNRNKRSVTVDLRSEFGREVALRLAETADVVIENFRPGTLEKWGLGYAELSARNPALVMTRISGFGQSGPHRHRRGFGTLAEGYSGYAHITGEADGPPLLPAFGLADSTTGLAGAYLTMVALQARRSNEMKGQVVDLALYEPLFTLLGPQVIDYDQLGMVQGRSGSRLAFAAPRNTYLTRDKKWVILAGSSQGAFERICKALDCQHLISDPRFPNNRERLRNVEVLDAEIQEAVSRRTQAEVLDACSAAEATAEAVYDVQRIMQDPHYSARENIVRVSDEELGHVRMQNVLGKLSETPGAVRAAGPRLGEHNEDILVKELGYSEDELRVAGLSARFSSPSK
jgi:crotonobetainyl-CoA:carnitine CoA-transferase CaiB-like acyl-CoA transferase